MCVSNFWSQTYLRRQTEEAFPKTNPLSPFKQRLSAASKRSGDESKRTLFLGVKG